MACPVISSRPFLQSVGWNNHAVSKIFRWCMLPELKVTCNEVWVHALRARPARNLKASPSCFIKQCHNSRGKEVSATAYRRTHILQVIDWIIDKSCKQQLQWRSVDVRICLLYLEGLKQMGDLSVTLGSMGTAIGVNKCPIIHWQILAMFVWFLNFKEFCLKSCTPFIKSNSWFSFFFFCFSSLK